MTDITIFYVPDSIWCGENGMGNWLHDNIGEDDWDAWPKEYPDELFWFKYEEDAMAFKLRWL